MMDAVTTTRARHLTLEEVEHGPRLSFEPPPRDPRDARRRRFNRLIFAAGALLLLLALGVGGWYLQAHPELWPEEGTSLPLTRTTAPEATPEAPPLALPPPDLLKPLTPEEALKQNEERPVVARPDDPAARFRLSGDAISKLRAIDCLSQAVYYEAASEGVEGGRAVAQVVLNRVRHPAFPNSVCGVVYQGSERATGCQFTFTCDGSLARTPVGYLWQRSRLIATEALAGRVDAAVGHATHYHANYVLPYWADSLDKVAVIGRHIFYRLRGGAGDKSVFSARYAGAEPAPPPPPGAALDLNLDGLTNDQALAGEPELPKVEEDKLEVLAPPEKAKTEEKAQAQLAADLARGQLILGEPQTPAVPSGAAAKPKDKPRQGCAGGGVQKIKALGAEDLKVGSSAQDC